MVEKINWSLLLYIGRIHVVVLGRFRRRLVRPFWDLIKIKYVREKEQMSCSVRIRGLIESLLMSCEYLKSFFTEKIYITPHFVHSHTQPKRGVHAINPWKPLIIIRNLITCPFRVSGNGEQCVRETSAHPER